MSLGYRSSVTNEKRIMRLKIFAKIAIYCSDILEGASIGEFDPYQFKPLFQLD